MRFHYIKNQARRASLKVFFNKQNKVDNVFELLYKYIHQ